MSAPGAHRICEIAIWLGGTLLPDLRTAAAATCDTAHVREPHRSVKLHQLVEQLTWGIVTPDVFARELGATCDPPPAPDAVVARLLAAVHPQPGMVALVGSLAAQLPVRFVCDYPRPWLATLVAGGELGAHIETGQTVYTAEVHADGESWCRALIAAGVLTLGNTLWIDGDTRRAVTALRHGVDAALYADAEHLRRDLGLWRLPIAL